MHRGKAHYDPMIVIPEAEIERVEIWVDGAGIWNAHHVGPDRLIKATAPGGVRREDVETQIAELWPGLTVYEVREGEDSTWADRKGPSPRHWQQNVPVAEMPQVIEERPATDEGWEGSDADYLAHQLRAIQVPLAGVWLYRDDVVQMLLAVAAEYEEARNPSAAQALREVAETWSQ